MDEWVNKWMNGLTNGWMGKQMDEWVNEWMDEQTDG